MSAGSWLTRNSAGAETALVKECIFVFVSEAVCVGVASRILLVTLTATLFGQRKRWICRLCSATILMGGASCLLRGSDCELCPCAVKPAK